MKWNQARVLAFKERGRTLIVGFAVLGVLLVNVFLEGYLYPYKIVNGAACYCGYPGWVVYWVWGIYTLTAAVVILVLVGFLHVAFDLRKKLGRNRGTEPPS